MIFTPTQQINGRKVKLNSKIRSLLGLVNGYKLSFSVAKDDDNNLVNEIIVTPYTQSNWKFTWVLDGQFNDRPGIISEITKFLKEENIDILGAKIITVEQNKYLKVRIDFNAANYKSEFDSTCTERYENKIMVLEELEAKIVASFINDISFLDGFFASPNISIRRNYDLIIAERDAISRNTIILTDNELKFPTEPFRIIKDSFTEHYPHIKNLKGKDAEPRCCITADFDSTLIRMTVFYKNCGFLHFRVLYEDSIGAISILTDAIRSRNINILQLNVRKVNTDNSIVDFLVSYPPEFDKENDDNKFIHFVKSFIEENETLKTELKTKFILPPFYE